MCGRYFLKSTPDQLTDTFGCDVRDNFPPRYNIAPTQPIAVIRQNERRQREYALVRWGFIPSWSRRVEGKPLINARAETVLEKPSFQSAYKRRRCLIPADGFYEWQRIAGEGNHPFAITRRDQSLFAFAGIWEALCDPDGGEIDTAAILTTATGPDLRKLHYREPIVIAPEHFTLWLEGDERDLALMAPLLAPAPKSSWAFHKVAPTVGNIRNDGPQLIEPDQALPLFS